MTDEIIRALIKKISLLLAFVAMLCIFCISLLTTIDVSARFLLRTSIEGNIEICEVLMVLVAFLGLSWADIMDTHVEVKFLVNRFPPKIKKINDLFVKLLTTCVLTLLSYASIDYAIEKYLNDEVIWVGTRQFVLWPARMGLSLGITVFLIYYFGKLISSIKGIMTMRHNM